MTATLRQFVLFGLVGGLGFCVDSAVLTLLVELAGLDPLTARGPSFLCATTGNWLLNRRVTFRDRHRGPAYRQWMAFVTANAIGGAVNLGVYAALIATSERVAAMPVLGVAAGTMGGALFNFTASKWLVFRPAVGRAAGR